MLLHRVNEKLLLPNGLQQHHLLNTLSLLCERSIDYADLYCQSSWGEQWTLEDGIVKQSRYHCDQGVGVRAVQGEKSGFAYTDQLSLASLEQSAVTARTIAKQAPCSQQRRLASRSIPVIYQPVNPLQTLESEAKVALLHQIDRVARCADPRVCEVVVQLTGGYELVLIAATDGTLAADIRPLVRLSVTVVVEHAQRREQGSAGGGGRCGYDYFLEKISGQMRADNYAKQAVHQAVVNLYAVAAPAGTLPVVLGAGWPGVLLHEAVGHGLEGDFNRKGSSVFSGRIGEQVASPLCTVVDDATLPARRGSLSIDDEGVPTQRTVLIENGYLNGYLQDKLNARLMGVSPTGNGRRESYAHLPLPRMSNTYLLPGCHTPQEIIASVEYGLYATYLGGGQVDITSGKFVFSVVEAHLIEKGKVTQPVKGATLIGSGVETMQKVAMVGNDLAFDEGVGSCGKAGQSVPVGVGQPTLKVSGMTVGGTG